MKLTVIDSGLGGIAFARSIKVENNYLEVYLAIDKEGFPYGNKELQWLKERVLYLIDKATTNVVLVACNTLSSIIFYYDLKFKKTVVDVITPTIYFLKRKRYKNICILATKNTIKMNIYNCLLDTNICYIDATDLINDIEHKDNYQFSLNKNLGEIPIDCDVVVLGCTHLIEVKHVFREKIKIEIISQDEILNELFKENRFH